VSAADVELTTEQRLFLDLVYEHWDKTLEWPDASVIKRQLYQRGYRKVVMDDLIKELGPALIRKVQLSAERLRLTLRGLRVLYKMVELQDFICLLRLAVDRYGEHAADKKFGNVDLVTHCGIDTHRQRKLDVLLEAEIYIARPVSRSVDGPTEVYEVDDEVTRYQDVFDIDGYLEARTREVEALAQADIPPVHFLAAEGVPWRRPTPPTAFVFPEETLTPDGSFAEPATDTEERAAPTSVPDLGTAIGDAVLRARCGDLLVLGAPFDRAILVAAVVLEDRVRAALGGSDRVGVDLMQFAFSAKSPKLRLSKNEGEQLGAMQLYAGVMAFFRNPTGHALTDTYTREDAVRFIAMVDLLLGLLARAKLP
jgi:uncharacterized protein (TIGR02391 family)